MGRAVEELVVGEDRRLDGEMKVQAGGLEFEVEMLVSVLVYLTEIEMGVSRALKLRVEGVVVDVVRL